MPKFYKLAATVVGTGLLALGGAMASSGAANAGTDTHVTSCKDSASALTVGVMPKCTSTGSVSNPTTIKLSVNSSELDSLINPVLAGVGQGIKDAWKLDCYAGSTSILNESGTFEVTSSQKTTSTTLPLHGQTPSSCTVRSTVSTLLGASASLLTGVASLDVSDRVTADTATIGALRNNADWCADDMGNSTAVGNEVAGWKCVSDQNQRWIHAPNGELVHLGRCLGYDSAGDAELQACTGAADQIWTIAANNRELHSSGGRCLSLPTYANGTRLRANVCRWGVWQRWTIVPKSTY